MDIAVHALLFLLSGGVLWYFAGQLISAVDTVAKRFNKNGFFIAFFVLGFLTSIGEISIMINSTLSGVPQLSVGNTVGASFVIFLLIIPFLAIVGNGVALKDTLSRDKLAAALFVVSLPTLLVLDGAVSTSEGLLCLLVYVSLIAFIRRGSARKWGILGKRKTPDTVPEVIEEVEEELIDKRRATRADMVKIVVGAVLIFLAGDLLVGEAVYFSELLSIPSSLVGLLILSIGTNVPEIVIAVRSVLQKRVDIAFGDYVGSGVANTTIFGVLAILNGGFVVAAESFHYTALLMVAGLVAFFLFSSTKNIVSRREGLALISVYALFFVVQIASTLRLLGA